MSIREIVDIVFVDGTLTSEHYCNVLINSFIKAIQSNLKFDLIWFMQDYTTAYRTSSKFVWSAGSEL